MCLSRPKHTSSKHLGASDLSIFYQNRAGKNHRRRVEAADHEEDHDLQVDNC